MEIRPEDYNYKALPVGATQKYPHVGCSNSLALKVTVDVKGCLMHCFKCQETLFVPFEGQSWRDRKQREAEKAAFLKEKARGGFKLPADFTHNIQNAGLAWLGSGGWTPDLITAYGIGWSDNLNRVVIPLQPKGYIARAIFADQKPKYLAKAGDECHWRSQQIEPGKPLVVTEDILSAGRVGQFLQTEALLGTPKRWIPPVGINYLLVWTDNDQAGEGARRHIKDTCRWIGVKVTHIRTSMDPKAYSDQEIRKELQMYVRI